MRGVACGEVRLRRCNSGCSGATRVRGANGRMEGGGQGWTDWPKPPAPGSQHALPSSRRWPFTANSMPHKTEMCHWKVDDMFTDTMETRWHVIKGCRACPGPSRGGGCQNKAWHSPGSGRQLPAPSVRRYRATREQGPFLFSASSSSIRHHGKGCTIGVRTGFLFPWQGFKRGCVGMGAKRGRGSMLGNLDDENQGPRPA